MGFDCECKCNRLLKAECYLLAVLLCEALAISGVEQGGKGQRTAGQQMASEPQQLECLDALSKLAVFTSHSALPVLYEERVKEPSQRASISQNADR